MRMVLRAREKSLKESARARENQRESEREGRERHSGGKQTVWNTPGRSIPFENPGEPRRSSRRALSRYIFKCMTWRLLPLHLTPFPSSRGLCCLPRPTSPPSLSLLSPLYPSVSSAKATPAVAVLLLEVLVSRPPTPSLPSLLPLLLLSYAALGGSSDTTAWIAANGTRERRMRAVQSCTFADRSDLHTSSASRVSEDVRRRGAVCRYVGRCNEMWWPRARATGRDSHFLLRTQRVVERFDGLSAALFADCVTLH